MNARGVLLLCALAVAGAPVVVAKTLYPFDSDEDLLAPASAFERWAATLDRHAAQQDAIRECAEPGSGCRGRFRSYQRMLERAGALSRAEQTELANYYINRTQYDDDHPRRIYDEDGNRVGVMRSSWITLYEFLKSGGDCEDYATSKYFMLRALGVPAEDMKVLVVKEYRRRGHHALLAVRQADDSVWLLDTDNRIKKTSHAGYRWVYALNEQSVWDHRPAP